MLLSMLLIGLLPTILLAAWPAQYNLITVLSSQQSIKTFAGFAYQYPTLFDQAAVGNYTILAPSDAAFVRYFNSGASVADDTEAFEALLSYHMLPGAYPGAGFYDAPMFIPTLLTDHNYANVTGGQRIEVTVSGANVYFVSAVKARSKLSIADIVYAGTSGGLIHIIDSVLTIPIDATSTGTQAGLHGWIQVASSGPTDPRILGFLGPSSDWTVFAPNSNNFPVDNLTRQAIFAAEDYCFVHGTVAYSSDHKDGMKLRTMDGEDVTITVQNGTIYVNAAKIIARDYLISTGVLHSIDVTMNPNDTSARPSPLSTVSTSSTAGFSHEVKAGISVGVALGAVGIVVSLWWYKRMYRTPKDQGVQANTIAFPVELSSREKRTAAELHGKTQAQVHEIGASSDERGLAAELWGSPQDQAYEIGVAI